MRQTVRSVLIKLSTHVHQPCKYYLEHGQSFHIPWPCKHYAGHGGADFISIDSIKVNKEKFLMKLGMNKSSSLVKIIGSEAEQSFTFSLLLDLSLKLLSLKTFSLVIHIRQSKLVGLRYHTFF